MEDNFIRISLFKFQRKYVEALKELDKLDNLNNTEKKDLLMFTLSNRMEINYLIGNYKECSLIGMRYINKDNFFKDNELYLSVIEYTANSLVLVEDSENLTNLLSKLKQNKEIPELSKIISEFQTLTINSEKKIVEKKIKKKEKNWDKIVNEEEKKAIKNKEMDGDPTMKFFQEIYQNADDDTKRAMMKSFETSNGQVLSTNWGEIKDKDYEGKDKLDPPKGLQYK